MMRRGNDDQHAALDQLLAPSLQALPHTVAELLIRAALRSLWLQM